MRVKSICLYKVRVSFLLINVVIYALIDLMFYVFYFD